MKRLFVFLLPMLAFQTDEPFNRLKGVYQQVNYPTRPIKNISTQVNNSKTIRIFFAGHWARLQYDDQLVDLEGGVYALKAGEAIQTTHYFLKDQGSAGSTDAYKFSFYDDQQQKNLLKLQGGLTEEHFHKVQTTAPLKHNYLEGIWQLNGFALNGRAKTDSNSGIVCLKYYVYPMFLMVKYSANGKVLGFAEGHYFYDHHKSSIIETVGSSNLLELRPGQEITASITLHDNSFERNPLGSGPKEFWISATAQ